MQPFSFYKDNIKLLDLYYLNPISKGSLKKYQYRLEETLINEKDTVFIISYLPKKNKNFDGLKGLLYVNSNKYAIQNVTAYPSKKGTINLKIQQQYQLINQKYWFPEKLNYELEYGNDIKSKNIGILASGKSYISNVELNIFIDKKEIGLINQRIDEKATSRDSAFWNLYRNDSLTDCEKSTYKIIDSIGKKHNFDKMLLISEKLIQNKIPTKYFDFDLGKTLIFNQYEGFRLGTGIFTNEKISKKIEFGGFGGFGIKDKSWKYGLNAKFLISKKNESYINLQHKNDVVESGVFGINANQNNFNFRKFLGFEFSKIIENKINYGLKKLRYTSLDFSISNSKINLLDITSSTNNKEFTNSEATINFRYAYKEKIIKSFGTNFNLGSNYPVFNFMFSKGLKNVLHGAYNYEKYQMTLSQTFFTKNLGETSYLLETGLVNKSSPRQFLFTGQGSFVGTNFFDYYAPNYFQTMQPYEFISDIHANLFLSHDFGSLLLGINKFKPNFIFHHNFGWGNLSRKNYVVDFSNKSMNKIFLETGLQFNNLIKIKFQNLGFFGFGISTFYRYGFYSTINDNISSKLTFKFTTN